MSKRKDKTKMKKKAEEVERPEDNKNAEGNKDNKKEQLDENIEKETNCPEAVTDTLESLQIKNTELHDKYVRLMAEFENFKKRTRQERLELIETASGNLITNLLPVIDDMERGLDSSQKTEDAKSIKDGLELIYNKMLGILKQKGLEHIECKGKEFDTDYHEALTMIENKEMKGKVVDEVEKGYTMKGKVIRFAKVVVGK